MKQLELFDEPVYVGIDDDYSGPHGDVREDFRKRVAGVPAARGYWYCPRCMWEFVRKEPCAKHMLNCPLDWWHLGDDDKAITIRCATRLFNESKNIPNRMKADNLNQRINNTGAEVACARILAACSYAPPAYRRICATHDPIINVNTYGRVPDIPVGRGIDVRHKPHAGMDLVLRPNDHKERVWVQMIGRFPHYAFDGFVEPTKVDDLLRFRKTYGYDDVGPCYGLPKHLRHHSLEDLIEAL